MSALPMGYDQPDFPLLTGVPDLVHGGEPATEPDLPFGLPPLDDIWNDDWGGGGATAPGLPYDLFGEDNGASSSGGGMFGGVIDFIKSATDKVGQAAGGGGGTAKDYLEGYDGDGGCIPQYKSSFEDMIVY